MDEINRLINRALGMCLIVPGSDDIRDTLLEAGAKIDDLINTEAHLG